MDQGSFDLDLRDGDRIAALDLRVQLAAVHLAREQEVGDDLRELVRLVRDHLEQLLRQLLLELYVVAAPRARGAVDRGERRAQLVRPSREKVLPHRLERTLL